MLWGLWGAGGEVTGAPETGIHPQTPQSWGHQEALESVSATITCSVAVTGFPAPKLNLECGRCHLELPHTQLSAMAFIPSAVLCLLPTRSVCDQIFQVVNISFFAIGVKCTNPKVTT